MNISAAGASPRPTQPKFSAGKNWLAVLALGFSLASPVANAQTSDNTTTTADTVGGPIRLVAPRQAGTPDTDDRQRATPGTEPYANADRNAPRNGRKPPYVPGEFELYVNKLLGVDVSAYEMQQVAGKEPLPLPEMQVRRLGADVLLDSVVNAQSEGPRQPSEDYVLGIGDEVQVVIWGAVEADLRLVVDRSGRINVPRVGPVMVAGVRYADLSTVIRSRVSQVFKNFQLSASLGRLRNFRIYVTGFTQRPGAYNVSSLSTVVSGLMQAGGPSAAGSFRQIELRRGGKTLAQFDTYDLLLKGNKAADLALQAEDVLYVRPVGPQAAILGSVNKPVIVELKPGETVSDVLAMAGGFSAVADSSRLTIERLSERNDRRVVQLDLPKQADTPVGNGDVLRSFSAVSATLALDRQFKRVRIEGEVRNPGDYLLPPNSTLQEALLVAGGLTPQAYVFGADFSRESVRKVQQDNYDRALRDMETDFTRATTTQKALTADEASAQAQRSLATSRLIERLRTIRPTGRVVLQLDPNGATLPQLVVEDGDRLTIPARPNTVGVFGSVFNAGSYLLTRGTTLEDVMRLAGGAKRGADTGSIFVVRANGSVVSARQSGSGWLSVSSGINNLAALPGDTIFVPEELEKTTFMQSALQWTQILSQFGLGVAAINTLK